MKILFVFDSCVETQKIDRLCLDSNDEVYLFPLTSLTHITNTLLEKIKDKRVNYEILETARMINSAAWSLRSRYIRFIAGLPERVKCRGRNLKEYFAVDRHISLWWLSLISEKNIYKSDAFNRLAQLDSIVSLIKSKKIQKIIFCCKSRKLGEALFGFTSKNYIEFEDLQGGVKRKFFKFQKSSYLEHIYSLLCFAKNFFIRSWKIKRKLGRVKRPFDPCSKPLMIITPYPFIDTLSAQRGIFRNKFYPYLQEALEGERQDIIWVAMYVENNSISFSESFKYAEQFIKNGYDIFFQEEFNSINAQIKALFSVFKMGFRFLRIEKGIKKEHSFDGYNFYPLLRDDWYSSFAGPTAYMGILYYSMFRSLLDKVKARKCLYLSEMYAWEKALISARGSVERAMPLYGYQCGAVSRMLLNYFNDPVEITDDRSYALPRPDKVISNGQLVYSYMRESGWPEENLFIGEAIRYNYLKEFLKTEWSKKKDVILLAFSISPEESSSLLTIAYEALKDLKDREVWVKPHPFLDLQKVLDLSGIGRLDFSFKVKTGPIENFLSEARVVIVGESGVSVEALAFGCEIIFVNVPEWINMSSLRFVKTEMFITVNTPEELKQTVIDLFKEEYKPRMNASGYRKIIDDFFYLNQDSDVPFRLLKLLKETHG